MQIFSSEEGEGSFCQHPLFSSLKIAIKKVRSNLLSKLFWNLQFVFFFVCLCSSYKAVPFFYTVLKYLVISKDPNRQMEVTTEKGMADRVRNKTAGPSCSKPG